MKTLKVNNTNIDILVHNVKSHHRQTARGHRDRTVRHEGKGGALHAFLLIIEVRTTVFIFICSFLCKMYEIENFIPADVTTLFNIPFC